MAAAGAAAAFRSVKAADGKSEIHAVLLHPGRNMWGDWKPDPAAVPVSGRETGSAGFSGFCSLSGA